MSQLSRSLRSVRPLLVMVSMRSAFLSLALVAALAPAAYAAEGDAKAATDTTAAIDTSQAPKPPSVTVMTAGKTEIAESLIVSGTFVAREEILVQPEIDGQQVIDILAEQGDTVKREQVLARLSTRGIDVLLAQNAANLAKAEAAISQATAQIDSAKANVTRAENDLQRTRRLRASGTASVEQLDQRQTAYDAAMAQLNATEQAILIAKADKAAIEAQGEEMQLRWNRTEIKSPADGVISSRNIRLGGIATMQQDAMFRIIQNGDIELDAEVTESDLPRLKIGQPVDVTVAGQPEILKGTIRLISPEVNRTTRLGLARIALPRGSRVAIGSFGRGVVEIARANAVSLPLTAVTFQRNQAITQVVKNGKVEVRKLKTGIIGEGRIEILDGVKEGEMIVAKAGTFLRDGDLVTPIAIKE
jgi:HlyD family secretion protein